MTLSIIIPVYNSERYLDKCLDSVLKQTFTDWECILVDDGSTDKSGSICDYYSLKDPRFKTVHKYNSGVSESRNLGIHLAKGDYLGFIDSDDFIEPTRYEKALKCAKEKNCDIVKCAIKQIRKDGSSSVWFVPTGLYHIEDKLILSSPDYDNSGVKENIFKTSLIKDNNIFFRDCDYGEDWLFNVEAFTYAGKLYCIDEPLYNYVRHDSTLSTSKLSSERYVRMLNTLRDACERLEPVENFKYFKDIVLNNFFTRKSTLNMRKNCVDYVVPFVDSSDPVWIEQFNKYSPVKKDKEVNDVQRFRADTDLFRYHFRGIQKFMPFIDTIHLLVSSKSQVPEWLDQSKVHVVEHKEFIPEKFLPTFNSSTIEMFLGKIPGLSEKFIYANDDFYYVYDLKEKFYFDGDKIISRLEPHPLQDKDNMPLWKRIFINSYNLARYGIKDVPLNENNYYVPPHIECGMFKSKINEIYNKFEKEILDSCSRFREPKNLNQYLYTDYLIFTKQYKDGTHSYRNFNASTSKDNLINAIMNPNKDKVIRSFVLNDTGDLKNTEILLQYIDKILPEKCKYEK